MSSINLSPKSGTVGVDSKNWFGELVRKIGWLFYLEPNPNPPLPLPRTKNLTIFNLPVKSYQ